MAKEAGGLVEPGAAIAAYESTEASDWNDSIILCNSLGSSALMLAPPDFTSLSIEE